MRLYIIGPVTGRLHDNRLAFFDARTALDRAGYDAEVPHDYVPSGSAWEWAMRLSIPAMLACDGVAMLPGWQKSEGAVIEANLAAQLRIPCKPVAQWIEEAR